MKRKAKLPPGWAAHRNGDAARHRSIPAWVYAATGLSLGSVIGLAIFLWPIGGEAVLQSRLMTVTATSDQRSFSLCHRGGGSNCVVDGDTLWLDGSKIRVADIDAPETHPPRCEREADLGSRATQRLLQLVNAGPFEVRNIGNRDEDQYGRKLRVLVRNGRSLGDMLVTEGLARTWDGARRPWC